MACGLFEATTKKGIVVTEPLAAAPTVRLPKDTAAAVRRGHPWVYGEVRRPPRGSVVQMVDGRDRPCGYGLSDDGPITVRVLGTGEPPKGDLPKLLMDRIRRADDFRFRMVPGKTDAWRVINGAGDGLPGLVLDRYGSIAVLKIYGACWVPWLDAIVSAVQKLPWVNGLLRRFGVRSVDGREGSELLFGEVPDALVIEEHGMKLLVRPREGQKTGLFIDQREHRAMVGKWSAGRRMANLFAYNGGFSVAAALGGASQVITVDIAPAAIEDARENFRLNGLDPDDHVFETADVFAWKPEGRLGMLVIDPPSLARGNRSRGAAATAYRRLHERMGGAVEKDGLLGSSSCTAQLDWDSWLKAVGEGCRKHGDWSILHQSRAPVDHPVLSTHPEGQYLKFALMRRLDVARGS